MARANQGDVGEAGVERGAVEQRPVLMLVRPRVQAGSRRTAGRGIGPMVGEQHTSPGQCVECRGLEKRWPTADRPSPRHWSSVMNRTLRSGGTLPLLPIPTAPLGDREASSGEPARSGGAHRRATELGPGADQPGSELRCQSAAHCSASGNRESGGRAVCRRRRLAATRIGAPGTPVRLGGRQQILSVSVGPRSCHPYLDHLHTWPSTYSLCSDRFHISF